MQWATYIDCEVYSIFVDGACEAGIQRVKCGSKWYTAIIAISKYVVTAPYIWLNELEYNTVQAGLVFYNMPHPVYQHQCTQEY